VPPPTVVNVGAAAASLNAITPAFPAGIAADDILVTIAESVGGANYPSVPPAGWAHIDSVSPVVQDTNTQLTVIWRRYDGTGTAPSLGDSGDHNVGQMIAIRGCPTTGNPWNIVAVALDAISDTTAVWPGVTTTVADCLILEIAATSADAAGAQVTAMTNVNYTSITERIDAGLTSGNGGCIICFSGIKATAGATGASTSTVATAAFKALMTLAMAPAPPAAPSGRRGRRFNHPSFRR
jgi:hypothetical protein